MSPGLVAYMYVAAEGRDLTGLTEDASPPELAGLGDQRMRVRGLIRRARDCND